MEKKKLGFGLMRLPVNSQNDPASIDMDTLNHMVDTFLERGFTYFDTAYMYHMNKSEVAIRETLVKRHQKGQLHFSNKITNDVFEKRGKIKKEFLTNS